MELEVLTDLGLLGPRQCVYWSLGSKQFWVYAQNPRVHMKGIFGFVRNQGLYTERPDGTYYHLKNFWKVKTEIQDKQLYDLIQSGLDPYQAFEMMAL